MNIKVENFLNLALSNLDNILFYDIDSESFIYNGTIEDTPRELKELNIVNWCVEDGCICIDITKE